MTYNMDRHFIYVVFFSKTHIPYLSLRKTSDKSKLSYILQNIWPVLLKTLKIKKQGKIKKLTQTKEDQEGIIIKCNVIC